MIIYGGWRFVLLDGLLESEESYTIEHKEARMHTCCWCIVMETDCSHREDCLFLRVC